MTLDIMWLTEAADQIDPHQAAAALVEQLATNRRPYMSLAMQARLLDTLGIVGYRQWLADQGDDPDAADRLAELIARV